MTSLKGLPHRQINDYTWEHWCRVLQHSLVLIHFDYCDHCCDPSPNVQVEINKVQIAMLDGTYDEFVECVSCHHEILSTEAYAVIQSTYVCDPNLDERCLGTWNNQNYKKEKEY